jgi:uncharacterized protein (TIGR03083 family)
LTAAVGLGPADVAPAGLLADAFGDLIGVVESLDDEAAWTPTGCTGWTVRDLTFHLLADAQRALVTLHTPAEREPDTDAASYFGGWSPTPESDNAGLRHTRAFASLWSRYDALRDLYVETAQAACRAGAAADPAATVTTQGRVMRVDEFLATLVVEAAVHHIDLVVGLARPGPRAPVLQLVRHTLDGLLGGPVPADWSDLTYARKATGRTPLTDDERRALGDGAKRFPLFS